MTKVEEIDLTNISEADFVEQALLNVGVIKKND